jgi:two-component system response regulator DesR
MNRILLADSNSVLRSALALLLETRLDVQIVGQVSCMESLMCEAALTQPDIMIIGMELPGNPTQDRIAVLRYIAPRANILLSSARPEQASLTEGTAAFLCQADPPETILRTIRVLISSKLQEGECHV